MEECTYRSTISGKFLDTKSKIRNPNPLLANFREFELQIPESSSAYRFLLTRVSSTGILLHCETALLSYHTAQHFNICYPHLTNS
jgi:hypothetical protein